MCQRSRVALHSYTQKDNHNPPPVGGMKPGMPGYNKCDRQGGWYKMKAANKSVYATTQTWSTALSRGQVHRRGTGICAGAEFDAVRVPNATKAMFGEPPISFWAGDAVPCWMPLTEHATVGATIDPSHTQPACGATPHAHTPCLCAEQALQLRQLVQLQLHEALLPVRRARASIGRQQLRSHGATARTLLA
eukprot:5686314-Prymnesium_polylepis.1